MIYLNTEEEIKEWLINHSKNKNILSCVEFSKENEQLIVNCSNSLNLYNVDTNIPFKFGNINGSFSLFYCNLNSFENFPNFINGNLNALGSFKNGKDWNIKEINGHINFCDNNCELDNLKFLKNTKFNNILMLNVGFTNNYITPFKDNKLMYEDITKTHSISFDQDKYTAIKFLSYNNYLKLLNILHNVNKDLDDYLDSFDNELNNEIK